MPEGRNKKVIYDLKKQIGNLKVEKNRLMEQLTS